MKEDNVGHAPKQPFLKEHVLNRDLVLKMLQHEERLVFSPEGQDRFRNPLNHPDTTLNVDKGFQRNTLSHFGFDASDASLEMYRTIFRTYFRNPDDYDKEVIAASFYMRNNRCVFYKEPKLQVGEAVPDAPLVTPSGEPTTIYKAIEALGTPKAIVCAFSES